MPNTILNIRSCRNGISDSPGVTNWERCCTNTNAHHPCGQLFRLLARYVRGSHSQLLQFLWLYPISKRCSDTSRCGSTAGTGLWRTFQISQAADMCTFMASEQFFEIGTFILLSHTPRARLACIRRHFMIFEQFAANGARR